MATLESIEELGACIKATRKHLNALEAAAAARRTDAGLQQTDILQLVTSALTFHRKQYDVWMQMKLDRFADVSWDECHLEIPGDSGKASQESSPEPTATPGSSERPSPRVTPSTPAEIKARVLRQGAKPALGMGAILPKLDPTAAQRLTPVPSPAAAELAAARRAFPPSLNDASPSPSPDPAVGNSGDDDDGAATPPQLQPPPGAAAQRTPVFPGLGGGRASLRPAGGAAAPPLPDDGVSELQAMLARRRIAHDD